AHYVRHDGVLGGGLVRARDVGLGLRLEGSALVVERLPGWEVYPRRRGSTRLFTLSPGRIGRSRANFRFTGCGCNPSWHFEDWVVHICNGRVEGDEFVQRAAQHEVDHRVHLYGGSIRTSGDSRPR
ncbi:hypothetical protein QUV66_22505, partial [Xanthomonas citri pv. citri]